MKQLKNFLIKREQSQARLRFAECEKSRLKAKLLLTLVALLALTTQAWAADPKVYSTSVSVTDLKAGDILIEDAILTNSGSDIILSFKANYHKCEGTLIESVSEFNSNSVSIGPNGKIKKMGFIDYTPYDYDAQKDGNAWLVVSNGAQLYLKGITSSAAPTHVPITWDATTRTATIAAMPAGNVLVTVNYFDEAAFAVDNNAPTPVALAPTANNTAKANTDDPLVEGGTVAYIMEGSQELEKKQGQLLFHFSETQLTADDLKALTADDWSETAPTADGLHFDAATDVYVYYYIKGADGVGGLGQGVTHTFSDTEIVELTVNVQPEPEYNVELAENTDDADKWKAKVGTDEPGDNDVFPLTGVKKGDKVTVKYEGLRKVMGVKAEKKAVGPTYPVALSAVTADYLGSVVTSDGNVYPAKTAVPAGKTAVGIVGKVTSTGHGLILALKDATSQKWNTINGWTSVTTYAGTTLKQLPAGALGSLTSYTTLGETAVSNWAVAQMSDYDAIFKNLGSKVGDESGTTYDGNVNAYFTTGVGGTEISGDYWSATEIDDESNNAGYFDSECWYGGKMKTTYRVRPVLGF